ncbi:MAG TPA: hypothetical protein VFY14_20560 [Streptomyces sp.]|nr:hypothetical protein [Streptomyces sp.]
MSRGRHRHAPPLHRMLVPSAVAAVALGCAGGAWLVGGTGGGEVLVLRLLTAAAALAAVTGAVLMRRWDREAGRRVGEVRAAKATAEWRAEERQAELESELEELRETRRSVETALRDKRAELTGLRTEHATLLRRYATAETERASALEGRRRLALEAAGPAKALTTGAADHRQASGAPTPLTYLQANEALSRLRVNGARQRERERYGTERAAAVREAAVEEFGQRGPVRAETPVPPEGLAREPLWNAPRHPASDPAPPAAQGPVQGPEGESYRQRPKSTAPRRGFDFFGTQRRRRAPGTPHNPADSPADQDEGDRDATRPAPQPDPAPVSEPASMPRRAPRAAVGKAADPGAPDGSEDADGSDGADSAGGFDGFGGSGGRLDSARA